MFVCFVKLGDGQFFNAYDVEHVRGDVDGRRLCRITTRSGKTYAVEQDAESVVNDIERALGVGAPGVKTLAL